MSPAWRLKTSLTHSIIILVRSLCLSISVDLFVNVSVPSLCMPLNFSVSLLLGLSVFLLLCFSVAAFLYLSVSLSLCLSVSLFLCFSVSLSLCLSVSLSLCLSVSLSLYLSLSLSIHIYGVRPLQCLHFWQNLHYFPCSKKKGHKKTQKTQFLKNGVFGVELG